MLQNVGSVKHLISSEPSADSLIPYWRNVLGVQEWIGEDIFNCLFTSFVDSVTIESFDNFPNIDERPAIYIANHQVAIESLTFCFALSSIGNRHIRPLAKVAHQSSWVGELLGLLYSYPGITPPPPAYFRDENNPQTLVDMLSEMRRTLTDDAQSLLVHAEGARVLNCRRPVRQLSSVFIDLSRDTGVPIIPVRFVGGLPVEPMDNFRDFPIGFGRQTYYLGKPIEAETLNAAHPKDRRALVLNEMNALGGALNSETPAETNETFLTALQSFINDTSTTQVKSALVTALRSLPTVSAQSQHLLDALNDGKLAIGQTPEEEWLGRFSFWLSDGLTRNFAKPDLQR